MDRWTRETNTLETAEIAGCKVSVKRWFSAEFSRWFATAFVYEPSGAGPWSHGYNTVPEAKAAAVRLAELLGGAANG